MYSGDGSGILKIWNNSTNLKYECLTTNNQFQGTPINHIKLHPSGKKILIHLRSNVIHSIDTRFYNSKMKYMGFIGRDWPLKSDYSADGKYIASGSEDGRM